MGNKYEDYYIITSVRIMLVRLGLVYSIYDATINFQSIFDEILNYCNRYTDVGFIFICVWSPVRLISNLKFSQWRNQNVYFTAFGDFLQRSRHIILRRVAHRCSLSLENISTQ